MNKKETESFERILNKIADSLIILGKKIENVEKDLKEHKDYMDYRIDQLWDEINDVNPMDE